MILDILNKKIERGDLFINAHSRYIRFCVYIKQGSVDNPQYYRISEWYIDRLRSGKTLLVDFDMKNYQNQYLKIDENMLDETRLEQYHILKDYILNGNRAS